MKKGTVCAEKWCRIVSIKNGCIDQIFDILQVGNFMKSADNPIFEDLSKWCAYGIRDPSFLVNETGYVVREKDRYIMYYNGQDKASPDYIIAIGRATSFDGINWTKDERNPVFTDGIFAIQASVIKKSGKKYVMYYVHPSTLSFCIAESKNGVDWSSYEHDPILKVNDFNLDHMSLPFVTKINGVWYMVFEGYRLVGAQAWHIYMASSSDGYHWSPENNGNSIYLRGRRWDRLGQANPSLYEIGDKKYVIFYNGEASPNAWDFGVIYSNNLTSGWAQYAGNPILRRGDSGKWDATRIEGARIVKDDVGKGTLRMWYFGLPTTDPFRNGKIGYATCQRIGGCSEQRRGGKKRTRL